MAVGVGLMRVPFDPDLTLKKKMAECACRACAIVTVLYSLLVRDSGCECRGLRSCELSLLRSNNAMPAISGRREAFLSCVSWISNRAVCKDFRSGGGFGVGWAGCRALWTCSQSLPGKGVYGI